MTIENIIDMVSDLKDKAILANKSDDYILGMCAVSDLLVNIQRKEDQLERRRDITCLEDALYKYAWYEVNVMDLLKFIIENKHEP